MPITHVATIVGVVCRPITLITHLWLANVSWRRDMRLLRPVYSGRPNMPAPACGNRGVSPDNWGAMRFSAVRLTGAIDPSACNVRTTPVACSRCAAPISTGVGESACAEEGAEEVEE